MTITLSAFNEAAVDNPFIDVVRLVKLELPTVTLYLSDRTWGSGLTFCTFNGQLYEPGVVISIDAIQAGGIDPVSYEVGISETTITLNNDIPIGGATRFTALFEGGSPQFSGVTVSEIFTGAAVAGDERVIFSGSIEDLRDMRTDQVVLVCSGFELDVSKKYSHNIVDSDTYPNADPDDAGKMLPEIYGSAKRVPFLGIDVGAISTLSEDITSVSTTIKLTDGTFFDASNNIIIDGEEINPTAKTADSLTGCARAQNSTKGVKHSQGAIVWEVKDEYVYGCGHPIKAFSTVYINNIKIEADQYTAYTGQAGDEHATYGGMGIISFAEPPKVVPTVTDSVFSIVRSAVAADKPIGEADLLGPDSEPIAYDNDTTITFPTAPAGNLTDIYVEYTWEYRFVQKTRGSGQYSPYSSARTGYYKYLSIDGVDCLRISQFTTGTLVLEDYTFQVQKDEWPTTVTKSPGIIWFGGWSGWIFTVLSAKVYCTSDVDDTGQIGIEYSEAASNTPCGDFVDDLSVDTSAAITFPAAPSGNLSNIEITYTWEYKTVGCDDLIGADRSHNNIFGTSRFLEIGGVKVYHIDPKGFYPDQMLPSTVTIGYSSWQTSVSKTPSYQAMWQRGEAFVITSATQTCYTDSVSYASSLSGINSVGDYVLGGRVSVDCDGYQDDGSGTYTGTPAALIERPDHVSKYIIMAKCGLSADRIDTTSYTAAGTVYATKGYKLAFALLQRPNVRTLLQRIAYQAMSIQSWPGGQHHLAVIADSPGADLAIDATRIDINQVYVSYTPRIDIENTLTGLYDRYWNGYEDEIDADRGVVTATNSYSVAQFGDLQGDQVSLAYIPGEVQAQDVLDWRLRDMAFPRLVIEFSGGYWLSRIQRGDNIEFTDMTLGPADSLRNELTTALLELVSFDDSLFLVTDIRYRPDHTIQIKCVDSGVSKWLKPSTSDTLITTEDIDSYWDGYPIEVNETLTATEYIDSYWDGHWAGAHDGIDISEFIGEEVPVWEETSDVKFQGATYNFSAAPTWNNTTKVWESGTLTGGGFTGISAIGLVPVGGWAASYRPTIIRVSGTFPSYSVFYLYDTGGSSYVAISDAVFGGDGFAPLDEVSVSWYSNDMDQLSIVSYETAAFEVSDIEFYDGGWESKFIG